LLAATLTTGWRFRLGEDERLACDKRDSGDECGSERDE
jgi:hypothetical protein